MDLEKIKKGDKKRIARKIRAYTGIPARTLSRTMKNKHLLHLLNELTYGK